MAVGEEEALRAEEEIIRRRRNLKKKEKDALAPSGAHLIENTQNDECDKHRNGQQKEFMFGDNIPFPSSLTSSFLLI